MTCAETATSSGLRGVVRKRVGFSARSRALWGRYRLGGVGVEPKREGEGDLMGAVVEAVMVGAGEVGQVVAVGAVRVEVVVDILRYQHKLSDNTNNK